MNFNQLLTPNNIASEREKFFSSKSYNPIFKYDWEIEKPSIKYKNTKYRLVEAILEQDLGLISKYGKLYFDISNFDYLDKAKEIVSLTPVSNLKSNVDGFVSNFKRAFKLFNLDYEVKIIDKEGFNFRPSPKEKVIYMSKSANFQFFDSEGEVKHELTHIIRYENGKFNKIKKTSKYLPTEEGLATLMQDQSTNGKISEFQHAAEYVASSIGINGSLRDIYSYLITIGFNENLAWQRASRHKFGFIDTKKPGDILKPAMYFANSQKISKLSNNEIIRLFVGKIALSELENYKEYSGLIEKEKIVNFYNLK